MNGARAFLDTNVLIYSYDERDPGKQIAAKRLIAELIAKGSAAFSYQVVHEFFQFALVKAARKMTPADAQAFLEVVLRPMIAVGNSVNLVSQAIRVKEDHLLSWYDSLIVAAAQHAGCHVLYSEDLQHGQQ